jgi:hypothetical protein
VPARISDKEPHAVYVHCAMHNLNLTLNNSVKNVPEMKQFYEDERLSSGESSFRVNNFNAKIDIVIHQLSNRFKSLRATSSLFDSIHPSHDPGQRR